jgi:beta-galactosidase
MVKEPRNLPLPNHLRLLAPKFRPASERLSEQQRVDRPKLWNLEHPNLYSLVTTISEAGKIVDRYETTFGIRTIKFDVEKGFLLNGGRVNLQGVCNHHDPGPGLGLNMRARAPAGNLKEMGVNAIAPVTIRRP